MNAKELDAIDEQYAEVLETVNDEMDAIQAVHRNGCIELGSI